MESNHLSAMEILVLAFVSWVKIKHSCEKVLYHNSQFTCTAIDLVLSDEYANISFPKVKGRLLG
jgi:hypothetical protein